MIFARDVVYAVIDGEREYQNGGKGNAAPHPGALTPGEALLCMEQLMAVARAEWYKPDGIPAFLHNIRKITAVGVQVMEIYGALPREGFEPGCR